ncbi:MAG: ligand-binding sensor domain-containing protein, partial [Cyclobacteriaceae bacterium]
MIKVLPYSIILLLFLLSHNISRSEVLDAYQFINYGIGEGLSQSTVLCSYQDSHGFIWLGTRDGLNQFDGYNFKIFRNIPGDSTSIQDNYINYITGDAQKNIWIATNEGLSKYNLDHPYFCNYRLNISGTDPEIRTIQIFPGNKLWIGSKDGIFELDQIANKFYKPNHPLVSAVANKYVTTIFTDGDKNIWVGTTNGLFFYDKIINEVTCFHTKLSGKNYISHPRIEAIKQNKEGQIWVGTYGGGVNLIDPQKGYLNHLDDHVDPVNKLTNNYVRSLVIDEDENLWIGTFKGLNIYDQAQDKITRIHHNFLNKKGLSHGSIRSLLKDKKGSIWIGTYMGGLNIFDKDNQNFLHYYHMPHRNNSLSHDVVSDFIKDNTGNFFIATERGGLNYFNVSEKSFIQI